MTLKEKLPLIVGIGLPIILIVLVVIFAYLPSLFVKPAYNFIYATGSLYDYNINVYNGTLTLDPIERYQSSSSAFRYTPREPTLFVYKVAEDKSTTISLAQAQTYKLDPSNKSPDGFTVGRSESGSYSFFPLFWGSSYARGQYLSGKGLSRKVADSYDFKFIGWVLNE